MNFLQKLWANKVVRYVVGYLVAPVALSLVLHVSVFGHGYDIHVHKDEGQVNPTVDVQPTPAPPKDVALNIVDTEPAIPDDLHFLVSEYAQQGGWNVDEALAIVQCESGGNPNAVDKSDIEYSVGLFQINLMVWRSILSTPEWVGAGNDGGDERIAEWLKVPRNNVSFADFIYRKNGNWQDWSCARSLGFSPYNK